MNIFLRATLLAVSAILSVVLGCWASIALDDSFSVGYANSVLGKYVSAWPLPQLVVVTTLVSLLVPAALRGFEGGLVRRDQAVFSIWPITFGEVLILFLVLAPSESELAAAGCLLADDSRAAVLLLLILSHAGINMGHVYLQTRDLE